MRGQIKTEVVTLFVGSGQTVQATERRWFVRTLGV